MPCSPVPYAVVAGSKPDPSSMTSNVSLPSCSERRISARLASAYFATLFNPSRTQKYAADSTACG